MEGNYQNLSNCLLQNRNKACLRMPFIYPRGKRSKDNRRKSPGKILSHTFREFASTTTAHGLAYIAEEEQPVGGRIIWSIVVILAVAFTTSQMSNLYNEWQDDPVITTLDTVALPIEEIDFPAITICPQGSVKKILDSVLFKQLVEYIRNKTHTNISRAKKSISSKKVTNPKNYNNFFLNLTLDEMLYEAKEFLRDVYPGAKDMPTKLVGLMTSNDPRKSVERTAVLHPEKEKECDLSINSENLQILNEQLNDNFCPDGFKMYGSVGCLHFGEKQMTYSEATHYCTNHGGSQLLHLESFEDAEVLKENDIIGNLYIFEMHK